MLIYKGVKVCAKYLYLWHRVIVAEQKILASRVSLSMYLFV